MAGNFVLQVEKGFVGQLQQFCGWVRSRNPLLRVVIFLLAFVGVCTPILGMIALGWLPPIGEPITLVVIYPVLLTYIALWGRWVHLQPQPYQRLGWQWSPRFLREIGLGAVIAIAMVTGLFLIEGVLGWLTWQQVSQSQLWQGFANALIVAIAVAIAEEILFRGWLLEELRLDLNRWWAGGVVTTLFAVAHAWGVQTLGLWLVGSILVVAKYRTGDRLGMPMGLHGGWVFAISWVNIAGLVEYTDVISSLVTGLGGNPLAGGMGIGALGLTLVAFCRGLARVDQAKIVQYGSAEGASNKNY